MNLVSVRDLHKSYFLGGKELKVLRGLEMEIGKNETVAIVGPSGVGKSTLLHLIGALDRPTQGEIYLNGKKLWADSGKAQQEMARIRAEFIGFVFQFHHLLPEFSERTRISADAPWICCVESVCPNGSNISPENYPAASSRGSRWRAR